ncbi:Transcription elongation factor SPT5 [Frankliniella fusca]|uniref:Transcription elongation factor SPT5 n=1 Tax=Frankliniella fusca TaxID=407009 RepID=A0AAE1LGP4_9NEOP|nr:Transcription elongation factor SPT5 [Frankliniella fusca]
MNRDDVTLDVPAGPPPAYKSALPKRATSWLPIVEQGCCCCSLRNCNLVQGWLSLLGNGVNILRIIVWIASGSTRSTCIRDENFNCVPTTFTMDITTSKQSSQVSVNPDTVNTIVTAILVISLIYSIISFVVSFLFIKGIRENKPSLMVHYIRNNGFGIFLYLVLSILMAVAVGSVGLFFLLFALLCGLPLYFLICANSLHIKMVEELEAPPPAPGTVVLPPGSAVVLPSGYGLSPAAPAAAPYAQLVNQGEPAPAYGFSYPAPPQYGQAPPYSPPQQQDGYPTKKVPPQE